MESNSQITPQESIKKAETIKLIESLSIQYNTAPNFEVDDPIVNSRSRQNFSYKHWSKCIDKETLKVHCYTCIKIKANSGYRSNELPFASCLCPQCRHIFCEKHDNSHKKKKCYLCNKYTGCYIGDINKICCWECWY